MIDTDRVNLKLSLDRVMYEQLIHVANQVDMNAYDLVRSLIEYTVKEYASK